MLYSKLSRRMFLQGAAGAALSIPFLESMMPSVASAATPQPTKRFFTISSTFEYGYHRNWFPSLNAPSKSLSSAGHHTMHYGKLSDYLVNKQRLSLALPAELNAHVGSMSLFRGLDYGAKYGHSNRSGVQIGNLGGGVLGEAELRSLPVQMTIDQVLNRSSRFNPFNKNLLLLSNGVNATNSIGPDAAGNLYSRRPLGTNVLDVFNKLFNFGSVPEAGQTSTLIIHPRKDVLTRVLEDYNRIMQGRQISAIDKLVLSNALDKLSDVQRGLSEEVKSGALCRYKALDTAQGVAPAMYTSSLTYKNYANIISAAAQCDLIRVMNFTGEIDGAYNRSPDPNLDFHSGISHQLDRIIGGQPNHEYMAQICGDLLKNFVRPLLDGLDAAIDPVNNKSFLYNSLVNFNLESGVVHGYTSAPTLLFGSAGGVLPTDFYADYTNYSLPAYSFDPESRPGIPYNRILVTMMQALGLQPSDYERTSDVNTNFLGRTDGLYGEQNNGIARLGGYGNIGPVNPGALANPSRFYNHWSGHNYHYYKDPVPLPRTS
ncbi:MAG: DUF1552 domain-containing protein [Proteobacteria bacterium]|nr:MAG: DUF1552 domain-containing protein [Pseudomonadota bacterium]